jgi:cation:H+ antiporter
VLGYLAGLRVLHSNRSVGPSPQRAALDGSGPPLFGPTPAEAAGAWSAVAPQGTLATPPTVRPAGPAVGTTLRQAAVGFGIATVIILITARFLASSAAEVAGQLGISTGFMGIAILALATSLPELVVAVTSVRAGAYDLAVGNLLGSCAFNMVILLALDLADGPGSLLAGVEPAVLVGAVFGVIMLSQVSLEVLHRAERRVWFVEPNALLLVATYALALYCTFQAGSGVGH